MGYVVRMNQTKTLENVFCDDLNFTQPKWLTTSNYELKKIGWSLRKVDLLLQLNFVQNAIIRLPWLIIILPTNGNFVDQVWTYAAEWFFCN